METTAIIAIAASATSLINPILIWFFAKRHFQRVEIKGEEVKIESTQADVFNKNIGIYQRMLDDVEGRYERQLTQRDATIGLLASNIEKQDAIISKQDTVIESLNKRLKKLEI